MSGMSLGRWRGHRHWVSFNNNRLRFQRVSGPGPGSIETKYQENYEDKNFRPEVRNQLPGLGCRQGLGLNDSSSSNNSTHSCGTKYTPPIHMLQLCQLILTICLWVGYLLSPCPFFKAGNSDKERNLPKATQQVPELRLNQGFLAPRRRLNNRSQWPLRVDAPLKSPNVREPWLRLSLQVSIQKHQLWDGLQTGCRKEAWPVTMSHCPLKKNIPALLNKQQFMF